MRRIVVFIYFEEDFINYYFVYSLEFSVYIIVSSENRDSFISAFQNCLFKFFSFFFALAY